MRAKIKLLILLLFLVVVGCTNNTVAPEPNPPVVEKDYYITYVNNNKVYFRDIEKSDPQLVFESQEDIDIIIPNPTMRVIAFTTKPKDNEAGKLKIYDWGKDQLFIVGKVKSDVPYISWSDDGCFLLKYESEIGDWGNALIYDFVSQRVCCELSSVGEPSWNIDSNTILAHVPQDLKEPIPFGDGHSSSVVLYDVTDNISKTIFKGDSKTIYRSLKWISENEIAYRHFDVAKGEEQIRMLNLITAEDIDITDRVNELIFNNPEVPQKFYEYQYFELSQENRYAILFTMTDSQNKIEIYDMESEEVDELAEGYCASWVRWKLKQ